ncbi:hypothetical protein LTR96_011229 [Exophiala xenobiotica]|nr:hypothetical protein LTR72_011796 [Exophiala xenobiotica]KAK5220322.1 hypothetical protein LTR47_011240 [Exophiala xenobiotica]KAK5243809.1 hypothetical protein LTS06_010505 [Exophiala xenobiotica]KAK5263354.1 hypothetical protein LTR96_011229 [Exophiala xenobiotica]KAK5284688.1 hypothetical protein LTR14_011570 [Exophiala xenobiotica]
MPPDPIAMAGVGEAASVLALAIFAYDTSKSLYEAVSSFKSQRKAIQDLQADLGALVTVLDLIGQQIRGSNEEHKFEPLRQPIRCCTSTCEDMQEMLNTCTRHTKDDHDSMRDWLKMQFHGKNFADMKQRLASYKSTLSIARDHGATQESITDLKGLIEGTKQDLNDQVERVEAAILSAAESLRDGLQADSAQLQSALQALAQAQQVADTTRPEIVIESNRAGQDSQTLFGTDTSRLNFDLRVSGHEAGERAVMAAGVHSTETLLALLNGSGRADVALTVQAMQSRPQGANKGTPHIDLSRIVAQQLTMSGERPSIEHHPPHVGVSERRELSQGVPVSRRPDNATQEEDGS